MRFRRGPARCLPAQPVDDAAVDRAAAVLTSREPTLLLLGGAGTREPGLRAASRICAATGAQMLGEVFPARQPRGAGVPPLERLAYLAEAAQKQLQGIRHIVLAGARSPVSFFAYPRPAVRPGPRRRVRAHPGRRDRGRHRYPRGPRRPRRPRHRPSARGPGPARRPDRGARRQHPGRGGRRHPAGERDRRRRGADLQPRPAGRHRERAHATTGSPRPAGRSGRACPPHSAPRSPPPAGRCCACKPTAAPFTPTRRCGRWPASRPT